MYVRTVLSAREAAKGSHGTYILLIVPASLQEHHIELSTAGRCTLAEATHGLPLASRGEH